MSGVREIKYEIRWIRISAYASIVLGVFGMWLTLVTESSAIMLDAAYTLVCAATDLILAEACRKLTAPANKSFTYGYYKFEPLMIVIEGLLILGSSVLALVTSIRDIIHARMPAFFGLSIASQASVAIFSCVLAALLWKRSKQHHSALLKAQSVEWFIDGGLSVFIACGFIIGLVLLHTPYAYLVKYIDPILVCGIVCVAGYFPFTLLKNGINDLIDAAPKGSVRLMQHIEEMGKSAFKKMHLQGTIQVTRFRKAGRKYFIKIHYVGQADPPLHELKQVVNNLQCQIDKEYENVEVQMLIAEPLALDKSI